MAAAKMLWNMCLAILLANVCSGGLLRVPKVYNAIISSSDNLTPSRAFPLIQPVVHETAVGYPLSPVIYHEAPPPYQAPEISNDEVGNDGKEPEQQPKSDPEKAESSKTPVNKSKEQESAQFRVDASQPKETPLKLNEFGLPPSLVPVQQYSQKSSYPFDPYNLYNPYFSDPYNGLLVPYNNPYYQSPFAQSPFNPYIVHNPFYNLAPHSHGHPEEHPQKPQQPQQPEQPQQPQIPQQPLPPQFRPQPPPQGQPQPPLQFNPQPPPQLGPQPQQPPPQLRPQPQQPPPQLRPQPQQPPPQLRPQPQQPPPQLRPQQPSPQQPLPQLRPQPQQPQFQPRPQLQPQPQLQPTPQLQSQPQPQFDPRYQEQDPQWSFPQDSAAQWPPQFESTQQQDRSPFQQTLNTVPPLNIKNNASKNSQIPDVPPPPLPSGGLRDNKKPSS